MRNKQIKASLLALTILLTGCASYTSEPLANLTFDENCYCIHTLKPGVPNDYIDALRKASRGFKYFS